MKLHPYLVVQRVFLDGHVAGMPDTCYPELVATVLDFASSLNRPDGVWRHFVVERDAYLAQRLAERLPDAP